MIMLIIVMVVIGLGKWLVYTGLLWAMIRVQNLNYNLLGLFGSSLLGTSLTYLPVVGPYVGWAALVLCLWKCTGAEIAPDVLFTVTIASALMFCVNLFVIGWLMGNLSTVVPGMAKLHPRGAHYAEGFLDQEEMETTNVFASVKETPAPRTNSPSATAAAPVRSTKNPAVATNAPAAQRKPVTSLTTHLTLKGVTLNSNEKLAIISAGKQLHTLGIGDSITVPSGQSLMRLKCEQITQSSVILASDNGEQVKVGFQ